MVRAGFGMFHSRFIASLIDNLFTNNAVLQKSLSLSSTLAPQFAAGPAFPNTLTSPPTGGTASAFTLQFMDPHFRTPYSEQGTVAIERELVKDVALTASYVWSRGIQIIGVRDLNFPALSSTNFTYTIADANLRRAATRLRCIWRTPDRATAHLPKLRTASTAPPMLVVQLRKRFARPADLACTWRTNDDGRATAAARCSLPAPKVDLQRRYKADGVTARSTSGTG